MYLKLGLIGCGRIAKKHAEILASKKIEGLLLKAVCDIDAKKSHAFGREYGVPNYTSMRDMIAEENLDVAVILTESGNHALHALEIADLGVHVIIEKPICLNVDEATELARVYQSNKKHVFVVKQNRFNLPIAKLKKSIELGNLGQIFLATIRVRWTRPQSYYDQASWRGTHELDGGVLSNQAIHHIDLLQWMCGEVENVFAIGQNAKANIEAEDTAVAVIKFKSGALGTIEASTAVSPSDIEGSISVLGTEGSVEIGGFAVNKIKLWHTKNQEFKPEEFLEFSENPSDVYGFGHVRFYEMVKNVLIFDQNNTLNAEEGIKSLKILNALNQSMRLGMSVSLHQQDE